MRKAILVCIIVVAVALVAIIPRSRQHRLRVRTYFHNSENLQAGAHVRVDGVEVGSVESLDVGSGSPEYPIEVDMGMRTPYVLEIPVDSTASLLTEGVLGPTFVEIDTRAAKGPAAVNGTVLKSVRTPDGQLVHMLQAAGNALLKEAQKLCEKDNPAADCSGK